MSRLLDSPEEWEFLWFPRDTPAGELADQLQEVRSRMGGDTSVVLMQHLSPADRVLFMVRSRPTVRLPLEHHAGTDI